MFEKNLKCPECEFRTCTSKGINIHRRKKHELPRSNIRSYGQLRMMGHYARSYPGPPFEFDDAWFFLKYQRNNRSTIQGSSEGSSIPDDARGYPADNLGPPPLSHMFAMEPESNAFVAAPAAKPDEVTQDLRFGGNRSPGISLAPSQASGGDPEQGSGEKKAESGPCTPPQSFDRARVPAANTSPENRTAKSPLAQGPLDGISLTQSNSISSPIQRPVDAVVSDLGFPQDSQSAANKHGTSAADDHGDDINIGLPCVTVRDLLDRIRPNGRKTLRSVWPTCLSTLESIPPEVAQYPSSTELERKVCERNLKNDDGLFLALLGSCPVLDYDSSSTYDLVLRCSSCKKPVNGVQNMELHIRQHLENAKHPRDIPCKSLKDFPDIPNPSQASDTSDVQFPIIGTSTFDEARVGLAGRSTLTYSGIQT